MKKILILIVSATLLCACGISIKNVKPSTATIENVKYVDSDPFENCRSCSYGVYEKENGEKFKLPTSDEYLKQMIKGTTYNIKYEIESFDYPEHEVISFTINN